MPSMQAVLRRGPQVPQARLVLMALPASLAPQGLQVQAVALQDPAVPMALTALQDLLALQG